jgi:hypothetical protein
MLEFLVARFGGRTQSQRETLDLLHATHFPNSIVMERGAVPASACRTKCLALEGGCEDCHLSESRVGDRLFASYKSPGMEGILPALLQEGWEVLIPYLVNIFLACLATGYVPVMWRQVKVTFIRVPMPSRNSYLGYRDIRPISLTSWRGWWIDF